MVYPRTSGLKDLNEIETFFCPFFSFSLFRLASLCLATSLLLGLTITMDKPEPNNVFDMFTIGLLLIGINVCPFFLFIFDSVLILKHGPTVGINYENKHVHADRAVLPSKKVNGVEHPIPPSRESSLDRLERALSITIKEPSMNTVEPVVSMTKVRARRLSSVNFSGDSKVLM